MRALAFYIQLQSYVCIVLVVSTRVPFPYIRVSFSFNARTCGKASSTQPHYTTMTADKYSIELPHTERADRGPIRRSDGLTHPQLGVEGVQTLYEGLRRGMTLNPLGPCLGFRAMSSSGFPTPFIYSSYTECVARVDAFAAGLDCLNLVEPNPDGMVLVSWDRVCHTRQLSLAHHPV